MYKRITLAKRFRKMGKIQESEEIYRKALYSCKNNLIFIKVGLAATLKDKGDYLESWELYDKVLMDDINNEFALNGLLGLLLKTKILNLENTSREKLIYLLKNFYSKFRMVIKRKLREEDYTTELLTNSRSFEYNFN